MSKVEFIKIEKQDDGMRLNRWFLKYYPELPMAALQKYIRTKQIKLDGKKTETSAKLQFDQELRIPPLNLEKMKIEKKNLSKENIEFMKSLVVYKDENIIAINKPVGLAVQGGTGIEDNIDDMLDALCFERMEKPKLVHRLDKDTSGILVLARDRNSAEILVDAFKKQNVYKSYLALVNGKVEEDFFEIDASIDQIDGKSIIKNNGKDAKTKVEVLSRSGEFSLLKLQPITGRKHQLRVHMEYFGNPIVGDDRYFGKEKRNCAPLSNNLHLHAYELDLSEVFEGNIKLIAKLPEYFILSLNKLEISI